MATATSLLPCLGNCARPSPLLALALALRPHAPPCHATAVQTWYKLGDAAVPAGTPGATKHTEGGAAVKGERRARQPG